MAITLVQSKAANNAGGFDGSIAATFTSNVTAGSLLVAFVVGTDAVTISNVADGVNGAWTLDKAATPNGATGYLSSIYSFPNAGAGATTVTATFSSTCRCSIHIYELAGAATASHVDSTGENVPSLGANPSVSVTTGTANCCIIAGMNTYQQDWTIAAGTNFTIHPESPETSGPMTSGAEYWLNGGAAGSKTVAFALSGGTDGYSSMAVVAYKAAVVASRPMFRGS